MKVIFKKTSKVEEVSFGYAVNYLIPQGLAIRATAEKIRALESKKIFEEKTTEKKKEKNEKLKDEIEKKKITIKIKAAKGKKTFGSVGKKQILNALKLTKNQAQVLLDKPIKKLGEHKVELKIGSQRAKIKVEIIKQKTKNKKPKTHT